MGKFRILALESSAKSASCAISEDGRLLGSYYVNNGLTHSTTLLPMAEALLAGCGLTASDIGLYAVARGPGSFTGIRIGVAAVKGLMWGADRPGVGVSTLESMAYNCIAAEDAVICCAMDARRSQYYNALFEITDSKPIRICEDRAVSIDELAAEISLIKKRIILVGDGAEKCYNELIERNISCSLAPENMRYQNACGVLSAASELPETLWGNVEPVYLRLSQAERERLERENNNK